MFTSEVEIRLNSSVALQGSEIEGSVQIDGTKAVGASLSVGLWNGIARTTYAKRLASTTVDLAADAGNAVGHFKLCVPVDATPSFAVRDYKLSGHITARRAGRPTSPLQTFNFRIVPTADYAAGPADPDGKLLRDFRRRKNIGLTSRWRRELVSTLTPDSQLGSGSVVRINDGDLPELTREVGLRCTTWVSVQGSEGSFSKPAVEHEEWLSLPDLKAGASLRIPSRGPQSFAIGQFAAHWEVLARSGADLKELQAQFLAVRLSPETGR